MGTDVNQSKWVSVEDYAFGTDLRTSEIVSFILDEKLEGRRFGDRWYVARPHVVLILPGADDGDVAVLRIAAFCIGPYVTAGHGRLEIPLRSDDPGRTGARQELDAAMRKVPDLPLEIRVNGERCLFDSSLWVDLGAALVEYPPCQCDVEHLPGAI